jgi:hypothetical protein
MSITHKMSITYKNLTKVRLQMCEILQSIFAARVNQEVKQAYRHFNIVVFNHFHSIYD